MIFFCIIVRRKNLKDIYFQMKFYSDEIWTLQECNYLHLKGLKTDVFFIYI